MRHSEERAAERLGFVPDMGRLLAVIHAGKAKFFGFGFDSRLIYDVPFEGQVIRVLVNARKTIVVSVLPPLTKRELRKQRLKNEARARRQFFRGQEE